MYSPELKSPKAAFLAMGTDCMERVRDNIPAGPEYFKFFHQDKELNWYEFWDHIADNRPVACNLTTHMFTIRFDEHSLCWECTTHHDSDDVAAKVSIILDALNENFTRSSILNSWERHKKDQEL